MTRKNGLGEGGVENIDDLFPFDSYRPLQKKSLIKCMEALYIKDYDTVVLELGTGGGKCISEGSNVFTEDGLVPIEEIDSEKVLTFDGESFYYRRAGEKFDLGIEDTISVETSRGYEFEGTLSHKIVVLTKNGELEWRKLEDLEDGDFVPIYRNTLEEGKEKILDIPENYNENKLPRRVVLNGELAEFIGWLLSDGYLKRPSIVITSGVNNSDYIFDLCDSLWGEHVTVKSERYEEEGPIDVCIYSSELSDLIDNIAYKNGEKKIPKEIFQSPSYVRSKFLLGLFGGDGTVNNKEICYSTILESVAKDVQRLLLTLGISSHRRVKRGMYKGEDYKSWRVVVGGKDVDRFYEVIGDFFSNSSHSMSDICGKDRNTNVDVIPNVSHLIEGLKDATKNSGVCITKDHHFYDVTRSYYNPSKGPRKPSPKKVRDIIEKWDIDCYEKDQLDLLSSLPVFFDKVENMEESSSRVYDINVPSTHNYVAEGFLSHNSGIGLALARSQDSAFIATPQKQLREQLQRDDALNPYFESLKARSDYVCGVTGDDCSSCSVNRGNERSCSNYVPECTYWKSKLEAIESPIAVITFAYLIVDKNLPVYTNEGDPISFDDRDIGIYDEIHGLEGQVSSMFAGFPISPWALPWEVFEGLTDRLNPDEVSHYNDVVDVVEEAYERAKVFASKNRESDDKRTISLVKRCERFKRKVKWLKREVDEGRDWVANVDDRWYNSRNVEINVLELKPVRVDNFLKHFVWSRTDKRVLMTATLPYQGRHEQWLRRMGLDSDNTYIYKAGMPIPPENRPIHTDTIIAEFSGGGDDRNWREIMESLSNLSERHDGENGLIHTASYNRAERVYEDADEYPQLRDNVFLHPQDASDADALIDSWLDSDKDLLVSPSMQEGVDLEGDMARWQCIIKIPFPVPSDSRISFLLNERPAEGWRFYFEVTATQVIQAAGRIVRGPDDYGDTYILDGSFNKLSKKVQFPRWFVKAIGQPPAKESQRDPLEF